MLLVTVPPDNFSLLDKLIPYAHQHSKDVTTKACVV